MSCQTIMPEINRYFIIEVDGMPGFVYSVQQLTDELRGIFTEQYYGADIGDVKLFEWCSGIAVALWVTNTKKAEFDSIDYAYPEWTIFKEASKVGSFYIQIDGRA